MSDAMLEEVPLAPRCSECGHPLYMHLENQPTSRRALDEPVPCFAAVAEFVLVDGLGQDRGRRYDYCGCEALIRSPSLGG